MKHSLTVTKEDDGTYTATIEGILGEEPVVMARCTEQQLAHVAVAKAARVFGLKYPDFGLSIQSKEDLYRISEASRS